MSAPGPPPDLASRVLTVLERDTGRTDDDLAGLLGVTFAELSPVIGRLYRGGLADRCGPYIVATPRGVATVSRFPSRRSGTSGTSGTCPGHSHPSGFRTPAGTPEPPEPSPAPNLAEDDPMPIQPTATSDDDRLAALLDAALRCARRGWHIFPLRPRDKRPAFPDHDAAHCTGRDPWCRGGHQGWEPRATTDAHRIRAAWSHARYNIGIATGPSRLVVIDLDKPKPGELPPPQWELPGVIDGQDVLAVLCEQHGQPWPADTFTVTTRRGGLHLYFTAPPGARLGNTSGRTPRGLGWLVDTRAYGGYVVAPGSYVGLPDGTGRYQVVNDQPPAVLPPWLARLLGDARPQPPALGGRSPLPDQVRDLDTYTRTALKAEAERVRGAEIGGRNHALNKAAYKLGRLVGAGALPETVARDELYAAASVHFTADPPLTPADARATITAGLAAGKRQPRPLAARGAAA